MNLSEAVAEEIRVMMARRRLSNRQLAAKLGVSDVWVGQRLLGRRGMDLVDLERIATALEVDLIDLLPASRRGAVNRQYPQRPATRPPARPAVAGPGGRTARTRPPGPLNLAA